MTEKSWVHYLCFDAYFEDALMKMRSATGLGATYALFTALNEYYYEHGYIDEKGYHYHKERYGRPLVDEFEQRLEAQDIEVGLEILKKRQEAKQLIGKLTNALENWEIMKPKAKAFYLEEAKANKELAISQRILELAKE